MTLRHLILASLSVWLIGHQAWAVELPGWTDITTVQSPALEVRFTSWKTSYVEGLLNGRWVGRYWNATARINWPFELREEEAFHLEIDGRPLRDGWEWIDAKELPRTERGGRHHVVELGHQEEPVRVTMHTLLDGTPVLVRWLEISNTSDDRPIAITAISPWSTRFWANPGVKVPPNDLPDPFRVGYFTRSDWASEGWFDWKEIPTGEALEITSTKGYGHDEPFFVIENRFTGEHIVGHLAWCSNWYMAFATQTIDAEHHSSGDELAASSWLSCRMGPLSKAALRVLEPGETTSSPAVHLGIITGNLDEAVQAMHAHTRRIVQPRSQPGRSNRIQFLAPVDQGYLDEDNDLAENAVSNNIDLAAAVGAEVFILDSGWYRGRGDWQPSEALFPDGIGPAVRYCHEKGLLFGMRTEVERCDAHTRIAIEHPDWVTEHGNLNISRPEVASHVESELHRHITEYELDLIRVAYDTGFSFEGLETDRAGVRENNYWRYYETFNNMFRKARADHPGLILQNSSAGIGRGGLGMAGRFHEAYIGDGLWLPQALMCYAGRTLAYPPESFVIAHGAVREQALGRPQNLDTFLRCQFTLSTPQIYAGMVAPSLAQLSPLRRERFLHYASVYKSFIRPMWSTCRMYHHEPVNRLGGVESSPWFAMEFASPDRSRAWATIVRIGETDDDMYVLRPRGLDPGATYAVVFDSTGSIAEIPGWQLSRDGIGIRLASRIASELLLFQAIEEE